MKVTIRMRFRCGIAPAAILAMAVLVAGQGLAADSRVTVDRKGSVGRYSSLVLDAAGNPVVSYHDATNGDLKIIHCGSPDCRGGGQRSITSPDTNDSVGLYTSIALDSNGYPVVSYHDNSAGDLKIMHCNDLNCSGSDESITSPDTAGDVGEFTSLVLDASGYPVVCYSDFTNEDLKIMHCNDPNCSGGDESITSPDTGGSVGQYCSVVLDANGYPVVSYQDLTNDSVKILHCNDPNCSGGNESITTPDTGTGGSLELDAAGYPVVSYLGLGGLKILHCNDPNCSGGNESTVSLDTSAGISIGSLELDAVGNPVVSYYDLINDTLKILHCNDPNCSGGNESITTPDSKGTKDVGFQTSLALDAAGNPVVSYHDFANRNLKVLHCDDANCSF